MVFVFLSGSTLLWFGPESGIASLAFRFILFIDCWRLTDSGTYHLGFALTSSVSILDLFLTVAHRFLCCGVIFLGRLADLRDTLYSHFRIKKV